MVDGADRRVLHPHAVEGWGRRSDSTSTPRGSKLPAKARKAILRGCNEQVHVRYKNRYGRTRSYYADFEGVMAFLQRAWSRPSPSR